MRSDGRSGPSRLGSFLDRARFKLRRSLVKEVEVADGTDTFRFACENAEEVGRAMTFFVKEEGTVRWIRDEARPGDVFYDIGANIGLYTVAAARRVGSSGAVYAFEPHIANAQSLMRNLVANGLADTANVLCVALADGSGFSEFTYASPRPGSSMSQLAEDVPVPVAEPGYRELKPATSVDELVAEGVTRPPDLVKIDVDGIEMRVLAGMDETLRGADRPRAVQVEIDPGNVAAVHDFLGERSYELAVRHETSSGAKRIAAGDDPEAVPHNAIFRPAEA